MNFNIVYPFFILIVALLTGCNDYKEEFSKVEGLTVERDELVLTSGSGKEKTKYEFNIKENSDLAISMLQHKDTVIVLRNVKWHTFVAVTICQGQPTKALLYKYVTNTEFILACLTWGITTVLIGFGCYYGFEYIDDWKFKEVTMLRKQIASLKYDAEEDEHYFKKELDRLEKENDYLQQLLQKRK